jgi:hypothetical protein
MRAQQVAWAAAGLLTAAFLMAGSGKAQANAAQNSVLQADYSHPELTPSHWTLTIHPDGSGHFHSAGKGTATETRRNFEVVEVDREIHLSQGFTRRAFAVAEKSHWFHTQCESIVKVAFMGSMEFRYSGAGGEGSCRFNYSENKEIKSLAAAVQSVAETILEGARLEMYLQHDRLGLDKETEQLTEGVDSGGFSELYLIRDELERLSADPEVLERVRKRAGLLAAKARE